MKKRRQKLTLSKETIRDLQGDPLGRHVVGGGTDSCDRSCTCPTLDRTCYCTQDRTCTCFSEEPTIC